MNLMVKNWDKWQSFRKDRGAPPWIKVYRNLLTDPKWASLSDSEKGQLVSIWIVAAERSGEITSDTKILQKICMLDEVPNVNKFIELGFLIDVGCHDDVNMTSNGCQDDAPEERREEESRSEEIRGEKEAEIIPLSPKSPPYEKIINDLNEKAGTSFRHTSKKTRDLIKARFKEGFTENDFFVVQRKKAAEWKNDTEFCKYLRPETLYGPKFEGYLNQRDPPKKLLSESGVRTAEMLNSLELK